MNILEVLDELGIDHVDSGHHHCRSGWSQIDCFQCSPDSKRYRMGVNLSKNYTVCWACGHVPIFKALVESSGLPWHTVKKAMEGLSSLALPDAPDLRGKLKVPEGLGPLRKPHKNYLKKRGFNPDELEQLWQLKATPDYGSFAWRIFIPITLRGRTVSWTTRSLSDEHSGRYRSADPASEILNHKDLLYGEDFVGSVCIVVEGPSDCWSIGSGSVCLFGTGFRRSQLKRIAEFPKRYICFDNEPAAQLKAKQLKSLLPNNGETHNILLDAKDPGSASPTEIQILRNLLR